MSINSSYSTSSSNSNTSSIIDNFYYFKVEQLTLLSVLLIIIVVGNLAILYTLIFTRSRKSRMNYFITHLALADLSVGIINVLTDLVWKLTIEWHAGNFGCKIIRFMQVVVTYSSTYVLVALSIDRYDAIRHPMKFSGSWRRAKGLILLAWFFSFLFSTPILVLYEETIVSETRQCWIEMKPQWKWKLYITLVAASLFVIPAILITLCYVVIVMTIWSKNKSKSLVMVPKNHQQVRKNSENNKRASSRGLIPKAKIKTIKITLVIVTVFIICWLPYMTFDLLQVYGLVPNTQTNNAIATFIQSLAPLNSAANPIIYCLFSTQFCSSLRSFPPFKWICPIQKKQVVLRGRNNLHVGTTSTHSSSQSEFLTNATNSDTNKKKAKVEATTTVLLHGIDGP